MPRTSPKKGECLVSRDVPTLEQLEKLNANIENLSISDAELLKRKNLKTNFQIIPDCRHFPVNSKPEAHIELFEAKHAVHPGDYVSMQSLRSSALAKKLNTTSKAHKGHPLVADLLNKDAEKNNRAKEQKKIEQAIKEGRVVEEPELKEIKDGDLMSRGPVKNVRANCVSSYPYTTATIPYGTAAQTSVKDFTSFSSYGGGYECGSTWSDSPESMLQYSTSSSPDTVLSSDGYMSSSPTQNSPLAGSPFTDRAANSILPLNEITRLLDTSDLPDNLADFILAYSKQYTQEKAGLKRPPSADSGVDLPCGGNTGSPMVPIGTNSESSPILMRSAVKSTSDKSAKQRLKEMVSDHELAEGFHWALTCAQRKFYIPETKQTETEEDGEVKNAPGSLIFRDADGDSLLHIVVAHQDLAKIYALAEQMKKFEMPTADRAFDQKNKFGETPLYTAAVHRNPLVVAYLLELGANPNAISERSDNDTILHHVASRGLDEIVQELLRLPRLKVDTLNARGQTPILSAVKNHGMLDEKSREKINNMKIIECLLKNGADACIPEVETGKTLVHYAVQKMDVELLDLLKNHIEEDMFTELANTEDMHGETAVDLLQSPKAREFSDNNRQVIYIRLLASGAVGKKLHN